MPPSDPPRDATPPADPNGSAAQQAGGPNPGARIIKRYSNRKLYDTVESRYVTLPQIALLVRKGEDVRIIDNNSKEDLTSVTLAQILYEEERKQSRALPLTALKDLIHTSGEKIISSLREGPMGKFIGNRPDAAAGAAQPAQQGAPAAEGAATTPRGSNAPAAPEAQDAQAPQPAAGPTGATAADASAAGKDAGNAAAPNRLYGMLEQSRGSLQEWQQRVDERVRKMLEGLSPAAQIDKLTAEVRKLSQRVEALEARLGAAPPADDDTPDGGEAPRE